MSASISFPQLTDEAVLFQNRAAAQAFFTNFIVPSATIDNEGVVKKASIAAWILFPLENTDYIQIVQDGSNLGQVPTLARFVELAGQLEDMRQKLVSLMAAMQTSGQLQIFT